MTTRRLGLGVCALAGALGAHPACGQSPSQVPKAQPPGSPACFRAAEGSAVPEPQDLRSQNGVLRVDLAFRDYRDANGTVRYCYVTPNGSVAPNLRLHPGDTLILRLRNELSAADLVADSATAHTH